MCWALLLGFAVAGTSAARVFANNLEIRLRDHREAIDDFSKLEISIDRVRISPKSGLKFWEIGWVELNFSLPQKGETQIVLDLVVLDVSDHPPQSYEILIKGYELYRDGKLLDKIPPG